jgi:hypothetical protein
MKPHAKYFGTQRRAVAACALAVSALLYLSHSPQRKLGGGITSAQGVVHTPPIDNPSWDDCLQYPCDEGDDCTGSSALPCCKALLVAVLADVAELFEQHNIAYMAAWGTLLGVVRNASIVPHNLTADVDIAVWSDDFYGGLFGAETGAPLRLELHRRGLVTWEEAPPAPGAPTMLGRLCFSRHVRHAALRGVTALTVLAPGQMYHGEFSYMDFYKFGIVSEDPSSKLASDGAPLVQELYIEREQNGVYQFPELFPLRRVLVDGVRLPIPAQAESLLERWYGSDWRVVRATKHYIKAKLDRTDKHRHGHG